MEVRDLVAQFQGLQPVQHLPDTALKPRHVDKPGSGLRFPGVGRRLSQKVQGGLAKALRAFPPGRDRIRGRGVEAANPFVQRRAPIQVQGARSEESSDGSDLGFHAGTAGEHRSDRLPRVR